MGPVLVVLALVIVIPVAVIASGGALAALIGHVLRRDVEKRNEGSELIDLNI